ncbi:heparanase 1 [Spatholobus suberectus]|nr:heparanase 1 [Spatholobus suberectus]
MGLKVMQLSQPVLPHSPSSSQTLASAISSPSSKPRTLGWRFVHRSSLFPPTRLLSRSKSFDHHALSTRRGSSVGRACSASLEPFSDEEFAKKIEDLALKFQLSDYANANDSDWEAFQGAGISSNVNFAEEFEPPEEIIPANIERKANSVELPFSLRIIKKKLQWKGGFREAGESAYCSVKKAFSSMVFIIRELQSYTLQMRELLFYEDLQGVLQRVQSEMHASFVWLFQQVFSHTPTLMVYVMILLANFTVHSMGHAAAISVVEPPAAAAAASFAEAHDQRGRTHAIDSSAVRTFSVSNGKNTASVGGGNGGGGRFRPSANGTDGDGRFDPLRHGTVFTDGGASSQVLKTGETESVSGQEEEEAKLWNAMVEEASGMEVNSGGGGLDRDAMKRFVSPVTARIESDDYAEYLRTELVYQTGLSQDPNNTLLLANYAQFLYLVAHDYGRAEEYFKRAIEVEPPDAEAYNKYATFLWKVKNDLWAAEETYLEAISAEPDNSFYAANYAHFLWNTGGEDTCFPLSSPDNSQV